MTIIYMFHEKHGKFPCDGEHSARNFELHGWTRLLPEEPKKPVETVNEEHQEESEAQDKPKRGRPKKWL